MDQNVEANSESDQGPDLSEQSREADFYEPPNANPDIIQESE